MCCLGKHLVYLDLMPDFEHSDEDVDEGATSDVSEEEFRTCLGSHYFALSINPHQLGLVMDETSCQIREVRVINSWNDAWDLEARRWAREEA